MRKIALVSGSLSLSGSTTWLKNLHDGLLQLDTDVIHLVIGEEKELKSELGRVFYTGKARKSLGVRLLRMFQFHKITPKLFRSVESSFYRKRIDSIFQKIGWADEDVFFIKDITTDVFECIKRYFVLAVVHHELSGKGFKNKNLWTQFDFCWAVSLAAEEAAVRQGLVIDRRVYNPLNIEFITQQANKFPVTIEGSYVIYVGRLEREKGVFELLDAFSKLSGRSDLKLIFLGRGRDLVSLKEHAKLLNLEGKVDYIGFQSNPYPYIKAAGLLVLPSKSEAMGYAPLEAAALGVPFVVAGYRAAEEFFQPDAIVPLSLVREEFVDNLACKIEERLARPDVLVKPGVLERMDPKNIAKPYFEIAKSIGFSPKCKKNKTHVA